MAIKVIPMTLPVLFASFSTASAQLCGVITLAGLAVFVIGGKQDNDGQGTNSSPNLKG